MLDMLILAESELFVGISISTYSWYLREIRCIEVGSRGAPSMKCLYTCPHALDSRRRTSQVQHALATALLMG